MPRSLRSVGPRLPFVVLVLLDHRMRSKALRIVDAGPTDAPYSVLERVSNFDSYGPSFPIRYH